MNGSSHATGGSPACLTCRYWLRWSNAPKNGAPLPNYGDCRRHSPYLSLGCHRDTDDRTKFPSTAATNFCGDYKPLATEGQSNGDNV